jgi:hypothetical protein
MHKDCNSITIFKQGAKMDFSQYIEIIENKLRNSFDISRNYIINNLQYDLYAEFHLRNEKYVAVKNAVIYAFENNEYCLIKHYEKFDKNDYNNLTESMIQSVESIVKPSNEHMSSIITGVIVTDNVPDDDLEDIIQAVKQFKYNKGFAFGFKGWADIRLLLVSLNEGLIAINKKGKEVSEVYKL